MKFPVEFVGGLEKAAQINSLVATRARKAEMDIALSMVSLDFECAMDGELYSVGLYGKDNQGDEFALVIMVGDKFELQHHQDEIAILWVQDEVSLIYALIDWFAQVDPDIIIGWSVVSFDLALLYRRAAYHQIPLLLGRANQALTWKVEHKFRPETLVLPGRVVLDGIDWLKAAFYQFDSYSLENVARQLLGEGKAIDDVTNRGEGITQMFHHNKLALAKYNLIDCRLVRDI